MDESNLKSATEDDAATVVTSPKKPLDRGKREAEDAIEEEVLSAKKQKMEEVVILWRPDTSCANSEQQIKVKLCAENGLVDSESENKRIGLVEETSDPEKKPSVATNNGRSAASMRKDDSDCSAEDETSFLEDAAATENAHESLTKKGIVAPAKKTHDSSSSSTDITSLNEDNAATNEAAIIPSAEKSVVSTEKKDVFNSDEIHSDVTCSDENVTSAKKAPIIAPTEGGLVISTKKKNELSSNDESACDDDVTAKSTSEAVTIKKNMCSGESESQSESESDNETSRLDDDPKTPVIPEGQTTGPKTLFVGNLSFSVEREDVEDFFKAAGDIVNIRFGMNLDESFRGFGYVEFSSTEAAEKALHELNGKELLCRPVRLDLMKHRGCHTRYSGSKDTPSFQKGGRFEGQRRFVSGFNKFDGEDQVLQHFSLANKEREVAHPPSYELNGKGMLPHPVRPDFVKEKGLYIPYSSSKETQLFQNGGRAQGQKVFVCGFNKIDGEYQIRSSLEEHFGSCGEISRVSVLKDQDGSVRGIAFIDFKDSDGFNQALKLNGSEFRGSTLSVEEAKPRWDSRANSSGSGGGCGWSRGGGREFVGRSSGWDLGGSSGRRDFSSRSGGWDFSGRGGRQDFGGRGGRWDFGGRGGRWDFSGRGGRQDFGGRGGGWDFGGRIGRQNFGGRSRGWDSRGRSGRQDFGGRSGSRCGGRGWSWNESTIGQ